MGDPTQGGKGYGKGRSDRDLLHLDTRRVPTTSFVSFVFFVFPPATTSGGEAWRTPWKEDPTARKRRENSHETRWNGS